MHPPHKPSVPRALLESLLEPLLRSVPSSGPTALRSKLPHDFEASHLPLGIPDG